MAVTIDAPPEQVWPWLIQLGGDRAGWYSWDHLDNAGVPSAREVRPEWQDCAVGDRLKFRAPGNAMMDAYTVAMLEPTNFLGLHGLTDLRGRSLNPNLPRPGAYMEGLWGFQLRELTASRTRLVIDGYQVMRPRWLERFYNYWVYVPVVWIMQVRMLAVLKRNIERAAHSPSTGELLNRPPRTQVVTAPAPSDTLSRPLAVLVGHTRSRNQLTDVTKEVS